MSDFRQSTLLEHARTLAAQGDLDGAAAAYADVIAARDDEHVLQARVELAQLFAAHGQLERACSSYRAAIPLIFLAGFSRGTIELAEILEAHGDFEGAVAAYQEIVYRVGGVEGAVYPAIYLPTIRARAARACAGSEAGELGDFVADGPEVPSVFRGRGDGQPGAHGGSARPTARTAEADLSMLIGCGELRTAEALIQRYLGNDRQPRSWQRTTWLFKMLRISDVRGDLAATRTYLDQYAESKSGQDDGLIDELRQGLTRTTQLGEARVPLFPWGGESDPLGITYLNNPQLLDTGAFFRSLPHAPRGQIRFVMLGGPMCYLNTCGEHSCAEPAGAPNASLVPVVAEDSARVHALTDDLEWTALGVELSHRLLNAAQRCGEEMPWAITTGIATRKFQEKVKLAGHRIPRKIKPNNLMLDKPSRGVWLYHPQPGTFVLHQYSKNPIYRWTGPRPTLGWWRTPDRSDLLLQAWCDTISAGANHSTTIILPDTPMLRDFARRYVRRQKMDRVERTYLENATHFAGFDEPAWEDRRSIVCYRRFRPTLVIDADGIESDGDLLVAALDYFETHYQLRISPFDILRDRLLSGLLSANVESLRADRASRTRWRATELEAFKTARSWFEVYDSTGSRDLDLYAVHDPRGGTR